MARKGKKKTIGPRKSAPSKAVRPGKPARAASAADRAAAAAVAKMNQGDMAGAADILGQGLKATPGHPDLSHLAGQMALMHGDQAQGRALVEQAVANAPDTALFRLTLGNVYAVDEDFDKALEQYRAAVRLNPRLTEAHTNVGIALSRLERQDEAEAAFENAARLAPSDPQAFLNLAICNTELRRPEKAASAIHRAEALINDPSAAMLHEIGNIHRALGQSGLAREYYRRSLDKEPNDAHVWFALANVRARDGEYDQADEALAAAERNAYPVSELRLAQAEVASNRGDIDEARRLLAESHAAANGNTPQISRIADLYTLIGDFDAQERCLREILEIDPENVAAFAGLAFAPGRKLGADDAQRLRAHADDPKLDAETRIQIGFALGNYYRYEKRFDDSFRYYRLGNRLKGFHFDRQAFNQWIGETEKQFRRDYFAERADWGSDSTMPVLIVGMPRSGTTLTEQILSSHSAVFGAGEYGAVAALADVEGRPTPDFRHHPELAVTLDRDAVAAHAAAYLGKMQALAAHGEAFVTNKLPHNFIQLGLFGLLFPHAPVVHVTRDPRDNLLSIYFQNFAATHDYAYDLKTLGHYYRQYERLMQHWLAVIPNPVLTVRYEDLVADLPGRSRELAGFIGVPWEEAMLNFHEQDRLVQTASKWQVRQKLYSSSVGRWKPYERHLKPMLDALGPIGV